MSETGLPPKKYRYDPAKMVTPVLRQEFVLIIHNLRRVGAGVRAALALIPEPTDPEARDYFRKTIQEVDAALQEIAFNLVGLEEGPEDDAPPR